MNNPIYVPIDENGFADRENISIYEPEGNWRPFDPSFNGLYKPRYDDTAGRWVEGATPEEIEQMTPEPEPRPPAPQERIEALEEENAFLALELVNTQLRLDQAEQEQADLLLELVMKGVL